jgi:hypothetical protein
MLPWRDLRASAIGIQSFAVARLEGVRNAACSVELELLVALALDRPGA